VFSQPIGHDTVYNFDVAADQIDLIDYTGFASFAEVQSHTANDGAGDAVITLGDGQTITLHGVGANSLSADDFVMRRQGLKWIGAFAARIFILGGTAFQSGSALRLERPRCFEP
jgi:hypothetical protein